jgi:hypothetical protein
MRCALLVLRYCAVPRFSHELRALPPNIVANAASAHHDAIMNGVSDLLGPDDPLFCRGQTLAPTRDATHQTAAHVAREQTALPLRLGGLGMFNPCSLSDATFLGGSVSDSLSLLYDDRGNPIHPSLPFNPMRSHDAVVERLPQIASVRAA